MTDQANLERRYRRMLAWYPRAFQREHGQELLAVLMACTPDDQRRPGLAACADLIKNGLWMRLRLSGPRPAPTVRAAVRLIYAGAAVTTLSLIIAIISLPFVGPRAATLRLAGQRQPLWVTVTVGIVLGLVEVALWLWMAREISRGRNWARVVSTVLLGLTTTHLFGNKLLVQVVFAVLIWLVGLAAIWLLWRPASTAFFKPRDLAHAGHNP